jgi:FixJ family two-component response regulator
MPDMDGLEVQRVMAERGINMPVIVLTGHGDVTTAVQAMKAGAVEFLEKPLKRPHCSMHWSAHSGDWSRMTRVKSKSGRLTPRLQR